MTGRPASQELRFGVVFGAPSCHCDGSGVCVIVRVPVLERWSIPCAFVVAFFKAILFIYSIGWRDSLNSSYAWHSVELARIINFCSEPKA